jgi:hypothetical protein
MVKQTYEHLQKQLLMLRSEALIKTNKKELNRLKMNIGMLKSSLYQYEKAVREYERNQ